MNIDKRGGASKPSNRLEAAKAEALIGNEAKNNTSIQKGNIYE